MRSKKIISLILALSVILSVFGILGAVAQNTQKFYNATTVADATDYSWWQFETSGSYYKIKNVKTGWYLTNNNGTLALSTTADSDNELWVHQSNYGITGHIYSKVDNSYITLRLGTLSLLPKSDFSYEGTQSIRMFDENGNDYHTNAAAVAQNGIAVKITNRVDYDEAQFTQMFLTATENEITVNSGEGDNVEGDDKTYSLTTSDTATETSWWKFEAANGAYKIKNVETGKYLTNNNGTLALSDTADSDNELWKHKNNWGVTGHIYSVVDNSWLTLHGGTLNLLPNDNFSYEGTQSIRMFDANGTDYHTNATTIAQSGIAVKITNRDDYDNASLTAMYLTVKVTESSSSTKTYTLTTADTATETSWWKLEAASGAYKIKNVETGKYLTNNNGTLALSDTADTDNELWKHKNNWGVTGHFSSVADNSWLTLHGGTLDLLPNANFSHEGTQSIRMFDANGTDYHTNAAAVAQNGIAVKITNRDDYDNTSLTAMYLTVLIGTASAEKEYFAVTSVEQDNDYSWWSFEVTSGGYNIKNIKTGYYLTNNNGSLALATSADSNNEVWGHKSNWGITGHIYSMVDNSWLTLHSGSTKLLPNDNFSHEGTQSVRMFDENGTDYHTNAAAVAQNGIAVKITNRDDYDNASRTAMYLTATEDAIGGDSAELVPVDPTTAIAHDTIAYDAENNGMPAEEDADQYRWIAHSADGGWIFENVKSGLVLTDAEGDLIAQSYIGEPIQTWVVADNWGYLWKMYSKKGNHYLGTDGTINMLGYNAASNEDHLSDGINNIEWYEMVHFSEDGTTEAKNLTNGKAYYIYNFIDGNKGGFKQLLGCSDESATPIIPGMSDRDIIMDGQDTANPPADVEDMMDVKVTPLSSAAKKGSQIWIFKSVEIEPMLSIVDIVKGENTTPTLSKVTTAFTVQNKETGLFLTQLNGKVCQMPENGLDNQIWVIERYPYGIDDSLNIFRNYESGYQMMLESSTAGLYDPVNVSNDPEKAATWPTYGSMQFGPMSGMSSVSFARVLSQIGDKEPRSPEDGQGYYMYVWDNGYGGGVLEAVAESVTDYTTDIPVIEKYEHQKLTTYIADLDKGIQTDDLNWDLLYDAYSSDGVITGTTSNESGIYGVGFRHKTYGRGTSTVAFNLTIPEYANGTVSVALRLNDYYDRALEQTGIRVYINKDGRMGLKFAGTSEDVTLRDTGYSFSEGRNIYIEDNADTNVIRVFVDDGGKKVKVAECAVNDGVATMTFNGKQSVKQIEKNYGYNIYHDGYISVTTDAADVVIGELEISVPSFSKLPFANATETIIGGGTESPKEEDKNDNVDNKPSDTDKNNSSSVPETDEPVKDNEKEPSGEMNIPSDDEPLAETPNDSDDQKTDSNAAKRETTSVWIIIVILLGSLAVHGIIMLVSVKIAEKRRTK